MHSDFSLTIYLEHLNILALFGNGNRPWVGRPVSSPFLTASAVLPVPMVFGLFAPLYKSSTRFVVGSVTFGVDKFFGPLYPTDRFHFHIWKKLLPYMP